jgi:hypothetical protein
MIYPCNIEILPIATERRIAAGRSIKQLPKEYGLAITQHPQGDHLFIKGILIKNETTNEYIRYTSSLTFLYSLIHNTLRIIEPVTLLRKISPVLDGIIQGWRPTDEPNKEVQNQIIKEIIAYSHIDC